MVSHLHQIKIQSLPQLTKSWITGLLLDSQLIATILLIDHAACHTGWLSLSQIWQISSPLSDHPCIEYSFTDSDKMDFLIFLCLSLPCKWRWGLHSPPYSRTDTLPSLSLPVHYFAFKECIIVYIWYIISVIYFSTL